MNTWKPLVEIGFNEDKIPKPYNPDWFDVSYRWPIAGLSSCKNGEIVFSTPEVSKRNLFSRWYLTCLALAWINETTNQRVLAHICPGGYHPSHEQRFGTTYMRECQHEIEENLKRWRDECGITNQNMGMAGSCIFPTSQQKGAVAYLDTVKWMWERLSVILPGDPQILSLPSKGYGNEQHIAVSDRVHIARKLSFIPQKIPKKHISIKDIWAAINAMMKS